MFIKLLTYNIWFSDIYINKRINLLVKLVNEKNPDVICFQEVRKDVLAVLVNKLKSYKYWETSLNEDKYYGVVIFSKFKKVKTNIFKFKKTNMDRHFIIMELNLDNNFKINIVTTHLESEFKIKDYKDSFKYFQFNNLLKYLKNFNNVVICGDMNISEKENNLFKLDNYWSDCWILDGSNIEKKYTFDYKTNMFINNKTKYRSRLDRVFIKNNGLLKLDRFDLVGNSKGLIPSDHFGIIVNLSIN